MAPSRLQGRKLSPIAAITKASKSRSDDAEFADPITELRE